MAGVEGGIVAFLGRGNISRPFLEGVKMAIFSSIVFENLPKMSHLIFPVLAFSTNFYPTKIELSGNTEKCKYSSLRSQS